MVILKYVCNNNNCYHKHHKIFHLASLITRPSFPSRAFCSSFPPAVLIVPTAIIMILKYLSNEVKPHFQAFFLTHS